MRSEYLAVGEVLKAQGVQGELKVRPLTDDADRFYDLKAVYLEKGGVYSPRGIRVSRVHDGFVYLMMEGIADRDQADAMRGTLMYVDRAHAVELPEDAHFICDMIGCDAFDTQGTPVGRLIEVMQPGGNDVYEFQTSKGRLLVPALKFVVLSVDVDARRIVLDETRLPEVAVWED